MKADVYFITVVLVLVMTIISCGGEKKDNGAKIVPTSDKISSQEQMSNNIKLTLNISKTVPNLENGNKIYRKFCMACHFTGVAGAQALQEGRYNLKDWQKSADKGMKTLLSNSLNGYNNNLMPPKGTCFDCTEKDLFDAISYMYKEAKVVIK